MSVKNVYIAFVVLLAAVLSAASFENGPLTGMEFAEIPEGEFHIGSDEVVEERFNETPSRLIRIAPFQIMTTEVTQAMWQQLMGDSSSVIRRWNSLCGLGQNYPVYSVTWYDCREFISRLNDLDSVHIYSLPSEAQWEYAVRAGTMTDFFWEDIPEASSSEYCRYRSEDPEAQGAMETASLKPNRWGLHDMSGNVSEWCHDRYAPNYSYLPNDGTPFFYPCHDQWPNPMNFRKIQRGGSWQTWLDLCSSSTRSSQPPGEYSSSLGFRVIRVLRTPEALARDFYHSGVESIDNNNTIEGIRLLGIAHKLDPQLQDALIYKGFMRQGIGQTEQAIANLKRVIQEDPTNAGAHQMMGVVYSDMNQNLQSVKLFNRTITIDPDYPGVYFQRGMAMLFLDDMQQAVDDFSRAISGYCYSPTYYYARGTALALMDDYDWALSDIEKCIELDPEYGDAYMLRSFIQKELGNMSEARMDSITARQLGTESW